MEAAESMRQAVRIEAGREYDAGSEDESRAGGWRQAESMRQAVTIEAGREDGGRPGG